MAGHYFPVGKFDGLRFDEDNVHGECAGCNAFDHQKHFYGQNLKKRIGEERFEGLEERARAYKRDGNRWMRHEIEEKILYYKNKLKGL